MLGQNGYVVSIKIDEVVCIAKFGAAVAGSAGSQLSGICGRQLVVGCWQWTVDCDALAAL
jgi:hypothetical protein